MLPFKTEPSFRKLSRQIARKKRRAGAASALRRLIPGVDKSMIQFWPNLSFFLPSPNFPVLTVGDRPALLLHQVQRPLQLQFQFRPLWQI
jgi:hypothetical protein